MRCSRLSHMNSLSNIIISFMHVFIYIYIVYTCESTVNPLIVSMVSSLKHSPFSCGKNLGLAPCPFPAFGVGNLLTMREWYVSRPSRFFSLSTS